MPSLLTHLECTRCGRTYDADALQTLCPEDGGVLYARYDLARGRRELDRDAIAARAPGLWQIPELLPVRDPAHIVTLGEGGTSLLPAPRLGARFGFPHLSIKEEGLNPTGSFKARGLAVAVARAKELGARALTIPTAGNAGAALAAYGARAGLPVDVFMPADTPLLFQTEVRAYGATLHLVDGLIDTAGAQARAHAAATGAFDLSTLKEPYRCEGKKTMGYELAQAFEWDLPDARTYASGIRVPAAVGDYLILQAVRASGGCALAVSEKEIAEHAQLITTLEGIFAAPEGGATLAALARLRATGAVRAEERVVLFNTGTGLKYPLAPRDELASA